MEKDGRAPVHQPTPVDRAYEGSLTIDVQQSPILSETRTEDVFHEAGRIPDGTTVKNEKKVPLHQLLYGCRKPRRYRVDVGRGVGNTHHYHLDPPLVRPSCMHLPPHKQHQQDAIEERVEPDAHYEWHQPV